MFDKEITILLNFFEICTEMSCILFKKLYNLPFDDTFKMYCCALFQSKFKVHKLAVLKLRAVEYATSFLFDFLLTFILTRLLPKNYEITIIF